MPTSLPTITSLQGLFAGLAQWQQALNPVITAPVPVRPPFNFTAAGGAAGATGISLTWERVAGADGYQLQRSATGDFSSATTIATLRSPVATSFFDSTVVTGTKYYYRVSSTAGTIQQPQSINGAWSSPISATSGNAQTTYDTSTAGQQTSNPGIGPRNYSGKGFVGA